MTRKQGQPALIYEWFRAPVSPPSKPATAEHLDKMVFGDQDTIVAYSSPAMWKALVDRFDPQPGNS